MKIHLMFRVISRLDISGNSSFPCWLIGGRGGLEAKLARLPFNAASVGDPFFHTNGSSSEAIEETVA